MLHYIMPQTTKPSRVNFGICIYDTHIFKPCNPQQNQNSKTQHIQHQYHLSHNSSHRHIHTKHTRQTHKDTQTQAQESPILTHTTAPKRPPLAIHHGPRGARSTYTTAARAHTRHTRGTTLAPSAPTPENAQPQPKHTMYTTHLCPVARGPRGAPPLLYSPDSKSKSLDSGASASSRVVVWLVHKHISRSQGNTNTLSPGSLMLGLTPRLAGAWRHASGHALHADDVQFCALRLPPCAVLASFICRAKLVQIMPANVGECCTILYCTVACLRERLHSLVVVAFYITATTHHLRSKHHTPRFAAAVSKRKRPREQEYSIPIILRTSHRAHIIRYDTYKNTMMYDVALYVCAWTIICIYVLVLVPHSSITAFTVPTPIIYTSIQPSTVATRYCCNNHITTQPSR